MTLSSSVMDWFVLCSIQDTRLVVICIHIIYFQVHRCVLLFLFRVHLAVENSHSSNHQMFLKVNECIYE